MMRKTLAIATIALGLLAFGCDDDEETTAPPKNDAATDTVVTTDTAKDTTTTPDTVTTVDMATDTVTTDAGADASGDTSGDGGILWGGVNCMDPKTGVSALDFCTQYMSACTFDSAGGTVGKERYTTLAACMTAYDGYTAGKKGCAAYHLCVASTSAELADAHCGHPPELSLATPTGPCAAR